MSTTIVLLDVFIVSLAGIAMVLDAHIGSVRKGDKPLSRGSNVDLVVEPVTEAGKRVVDVTGKNAKDLLDRGFLAFLKRSTPWIFNVAESMRDKQERLSDAIAGRGRVESNGNASAFLKDIKAHKEVNGKKPEGLDL